MGVYESQGEGGGIFPVMNVVVCAGYVSSCVNIMCIYLRAPKTLHPLTHMEFERNGPRARVGYGHEPRIPVSINAPK